MKNQTEGKHGHCGVHEVDLEGTGGLIGLQAKKRAESRLSGQPMTPVKLIGESDDNRNGCSNSPE